MQTFYPCRYQNKRTGVFIPLSRYEICDSVECKPPVVRRTDNKRELRLYYDGDYWRVNLRSDSMRDHSFLLQRLLQFSLCGSPSDPSLTTVDHINRDTDDNQLANLRWADQSMQSLNRGKYELGALKMEIIAIHLDGRVLECSSQADAAKQTGIIQSAISRMLIAGKSKNGWRFSTTMIPDLPGEKWIEWGPDMQVSNRSRVKRRRREGTSWHLATSSSKSRRRIKANGQSLLLSTIISRHFATE